MVISSFAFHEGLQPREILAVGPTHGCHHQRGCNLREAAWLATIPQRHPRTPLTCRLPRVRGLHGERTFRRLHDKALTRNELDDLVSVSEPPAEKLRDESDPRADSQRWRCLPLHPLDVDVPLWGVGWICGVGRDSIARAFDLD